ncbi:uncharacterized protein NECHADRAFT_52060 [Fusarium vanettenii 77-13-4]|uniref:Uncharacterized protein n=1 Tax=Fusarium vanettenii (strain ATCC MYA-4622 / CBS 123669 / FGSC 9596 / NRRL 45880 / 77-13-4) TaxID=660122 RepID=C7ZG12_FUSV7|nr:uncharacterized protein NECHADRAFT_52060 [Fusarium vanettenii 77-13-4]EEU36978.1 hypothetical protein NECHADRAFT_52060 [Fusarium vanettenii 77-13-4]
MTSWKTPKLTWFITGAASGFGLELTRLALTNGHNVIATSRNPAKVPDLVSDIESKGGRWLKLDVDDPKGGLVIETLEKEGTGIDILVNNAGWSIHGPVESFPEDEVRRQMETVYFGPYRLIRAVLPHMRQRRQGLILNIGSGAGVGGRESMGIYAAAKAAMDGLTRILAREVAPFNIRTLTVQLGGFDTNFTNALRLSSVPFPQEYLGGRTDQVAHSLLGSNYKADGDHRKASQVIYEVAMGEGRGEGKEGERVMPLGRDMLLLMNNVFKDMHHQIETFRDIGNNVYLDKQ